MFALLLLLCVGASCNADKSRSEGERGIQVFAAASTTEVLSRLAEMYESRHGVRVRCSFGASSTLARQIEAGAPADVFLSADPEWMERLARTGRVERGTRRDLLGNTLVLIAPKGRTFSLEMKPGTEFGEAFGGRLALGDPEHVPAGRYARQALEFLGWWSEAEGRLIPAMDVRDALRIVALGEAGAGIVYSTDAATNEKTEVIGEFPGESHASIRYPIARVKGATAEAEAFVEFLFSDPAAAVFESAGFQRIDPN